jgi:hypothetical protein
MNKAWIGLSVIVLVAAIAIAAIFVLTKKENASDIILQLPTHDFLENRTLLIPDTTALEEMSKIARNNFTMYRIRYHPLSEKPLITIVTRTFNRPNQIVKNIQAYSDQIAQNFEHVILQDTVGSGMKVAETSLYTFHKEFLGQYVLHLDDDDFLNSTDFTSRMQAIVEEHEQPAAIVFKVWYTCLGQRRYLPAAWKKFPQLGHITTSNVLVQRDVYSQAIPMICKQHDGDYEFIYNVMILSQSRIFWENRCYITIKQTEDDVYRANPVVWTPYNKCLADNVEIAWGRGKTMNETASVNYM